jgi:hypothetical protein
MLKQKNTVHRQSDTQYNRSNWNHPKIIQEITELHTEKAQNQSTKENNHIGHNTHTS